MKALRDTSSAEPVGQMAKKQGDRFRSLKSAVGLLLLAAGLMFAPQSHAQNLIPNGNFRINGGDFSLNSAPPWTSVADGYVTCVSPSVCAFPAPPGANDYAIFEGVAGPVPTPVSGIEQTLTLNASGRYEFSFYHSSSYTGLPPAVLFVSVGGQTVFNSVDTATTWTHFSTTLKLSAGANSVELFDDLNNLAPELIGEVALYYLGPNAISPLLPQGAPRNAISVAAGIDTFLNNNQASTFTGGLQALNFLSGQQLVTALIQLDGETATDAERGAFQLMNQFLGLMLDPFVDGRFSGGVSSFAGDRDASLPPDIAMAYASVLKAPPKPPQDNRWSVWGSAFGGVSHANGDSAIGSSDVTANIYGFASGADYHFNRDTLVGFALAGAGTNWGLAQSLGDGRSDAFQAGVYGKTAWGPVYLAAALAYTENWFTTNRFVLGDQLNAKFNGDSYGGRIESGYRYAVPSSAGQFEITPYGAIQAQSFYTPSYSETDLSGGGLGLNFNAMSTTDTRSEIGAHFADMTTIAGMPLILRARLAWAHDWVDNPALNATFQSLPGASFTVNGAPIPSDSALASVGAELHMTPQWSALAKFDGEFAGSSQTYAGTGTLRYTW